MWYLYRSSKQLSIHRMPAEILVEIFLFVRNDPIISPASATRDHGQICTGNFALLRVTAVCVRWRLVAADFGALWNNVAFSTIKISSIRCAELFLGRTKSCMLHVYVSAPILPHSPPISALIRKLFINISSESHRVQVLDFFATSRTNILYTYWTNLAMSSHWIPEIRDDDTIPFCSQFPRVESMRLSSPVWYPGVAPCLKSLELQNDNGTASLSFLLRALENCPALESLTLQGYRQFVDDGSQLDVPATVLPNLRRFQLYSCDSGPILASLHLPSLAHPLIIFDSNPHGTILRHLKRQDGAPYLKAVSKLRVELSMGSSHYSIAAHREDGRMSLYLGISTVPHLPKSRWIHESMDTVTSFGPFSQITSLSITADVVFSSWSPWLYKMHHISSLDLCCPDVAGYLDCLSALVDGSPLCPSLDTLAFRGFRRSKTFDYRLLKACILFRRAAGCPLTSIIVPECDWARARERDLSWDALVNSQGKLLSIHSTGVP